MLPSVSKEIQEHQGSQSAFESRSFRLFRHVLGSSGLLLHLQSAIHRRRGPASPPDQEPRVAFDGSSPDSASSASCTRVRGGRCVRQQRADQSSGLFGIVAFTKVDFAIVVAALELLRFQRRIAAGLLVFERTASRWAGGRVSSNAGSRSSVQHGPFSAIQRCGGQTVAPNCQPAKDSVPVVRPSTAAGTIPDSPDGASVPPQLLAHPDATVVFGWTRLAGRRRARRCGRRQSTAKARETKGNWTSSTSLPMFRLQPQIRHASALPHSHPATPSAVDAEPQQHDQQGILAVVADDVARLLPDGPVSAAAVDVSSMRLRNQTAAIAASASADAAMHSGGGPQSRPAATAPLFGCANVDGQQRCGPSVATSGHRQQQTGTGSADGAGPARPPSRFRPAGVPVDPTGCG